MKRRKSYDASGRIARAEQNRAKILDVARRAFLERGYVATTIAEIANEAQVSVETIYKAFGGKPGLVRAIYQRGLGGTGPVHAEKRSDTISSNEDDPRAIVAAWGRFISEISPVVSPVMLLVRDAAGDDDELAAVLREADDQRLARMRHNAEKLAKRGFLRRGVSATKAAEIMWLYTAPELYELLVVRLGWSAERLGKFASDAIAAALLPV